MTFYSRRKSTSIFRVVIKKRVNKSGTVHIKIAQVKIEALEAKNARLEKENAMLLEQFVVWQYNAYKYGMSMERLSEPMSKKSSD